MATTTKTPLSSNNNSNLLHSVSLASTASSSSSFQVRTRALRPVAASIISYGRSSKIQDRHISKTTTLYVIRVARSGKDWYVARRYSEFRALHDALQNQFARSSASGRSCAACEELATFYSGFHFPQRFRLRSALFSKKDIEPTRMNELNQYLSFLMETTQGLLDEDDDDECDNGGVERKDAADETKCDAMTRIRDFLMVDENEDLLKQQQRQQQQEEEDASHSRRRPRLSSKSVSSFRVHELDVLYKENESGGCAACVDSLAPTHATEFDCNPAFADVFEDFPSPPQDAIIQHQRSDDEPPRSGGLHPLRRSESLSYSRR